MPSKDRIDPKANAWMEREGIEVHPALSKAPEKSKRPMAAQVQRIARRLGKKPDEVAAKLPTDTLRRLQYPVLESRTPDGKREFTHDLGISDGPISR